MSSSLTALPGLLVLIPAAIGMRGNIFGALGSRLGTGINTGQFEPTRERDSFLGQNVLGSTFLTLATCLFLGFAARIVAGAFFEQTLTVWDFAVISILGGVLGSLVVGGASVGIAIWSHRRRWDLASESAPLVTAIGDIATLPALWAAALFVQHVPQATKAVGIIVSILCLIGTIRGLTNKLPSVRRIVRESLPVLLIAGTIDLLAGTVIELRVERFVAFPALLILVPPFLEDTNALAGILSSRLASKLHLGLIEAKTVPQALAWFDVSINFLFAFAVFFMVGVSAQLAAVLTHQASPGFGAMVAISLTAGMIATVISSAVAYYSAIATYRFGLDPDNHGIPITSSVMDLAGTLCLVLVMLLYGVSAHG
jgi:mgtE-like transporter